MTMFSTQPLAMPDQDLIEAACHNACQAMNRECMRAISEGDSPEICLVLAAGLESMHREGVSGDGLPDCIEHLRRSAAPRRREA
jgi:hypothetical protein